MKICFATEDFYPAFIGGQGIYGYYLTKELAQKGVDVTVLAENKKGRREFWEKLKQERVAGAKDSQDSLHRRASEQEDILSNNKYVALKTIKPKKTSSSELEQILGYASARTRDPDLSKLGISGNEIKLVHVPFCFSNQLLLALFEYIYFIFKLRNEQFDILHANQLSGLFFSLFKPANVKKVIISAHNTNYDMFQVADTIVKKFLYLPFIFLERLTYRKADGLLFNAKSEKSALIGYYDIKNKNVGLAYLGKTETKFSSSEKSLYRLQIREKLNIKNDEKIILYVGRIVRKKRVDNLIKAIVIARTKGLKIHGILIGEGTLRKKLSISAPNYIHLLGFIKETKPFFLASDIFVTTGVAEGGVALSVLEAAYYELPLVLSPSDAGISYLKSGQNGYLTNPDNPRQIADMIEKVLPKSEIMGKKSAKLVEKFSWKRCAEETISFYKKVSSTFLLL